MAGLIEGEGHIGFGHTSPRIVVKMTDLDVIEFIASVWGSNITKRSASAGGRFGKKQQWETGIYGANAVSWIRRLYPMFGEKKRADCERALERWKGGRYKRYVSNRPHLRRDV